MAHSHHDDLRLCHVLADNADSISMEKFRAGDLVVSTKPDMTWVTEADQAVERAIRRTLRSARTRDIVLGEENGEQIGTMEDATRRWIIDPIDGTSNFVRGVPVWATLIAIAVEDEVVASCVSAPALGRRWWASKGGGAYTGKSAIRAGLVDEIVVHIAPVLFGKGIPLFGDWDDTQRSLKVLEVMNTPLATHIRYEIVK
jgi:histidinol-phosphatase